MALFNRNCVSRVGFQALVNRMSPISKVFALWRSGKCGLFFVSFLSRFYWCSFLGVLAVWVIVLSLFYLGVTGVLALELRRSLFGIR